MRVAFERTRPVLPNVQLNSGFWASRRRKPPLGVTRRNLTTSSRKKVNHEMAPERTRVYVSAANSVAFGGEKATQSRDESDLQIRTNTTAISDTYCWLGREELEPPNGGIKIRPVRQTYQ